MASPFALSLSVSVLGAPPPYETFYFNQPNDHFHFDQVPSSDLWPQRYLLSDANWGKRPALGNGCKGPILFYTGNEGPIDAFWAITGFVTEVLAPRFGALVVFGEERYYGKSTPKSSNFEFLSTEQVLADYANLITSLKKNLSAVNCPVIAFGGSYGGTLTTLFRLKYPHIVAGGLAASAPLGYYAPGGWAERGVTQTTWFETVKRVYSEAGSNCYEDLVAAVQEVNATLRKPDEAAAVAKQFGLCGVPQTPHDVDEFVFWITEALESIPQVDYPEASGTLPGSPVNATCTLLASPAPALVAVLAQVTLWYYGPPGDSDARARNSSGLAVCRPLSAARNQQVGGGVPGDGPDGASSWGYQSCTETLHAFSTVPGAWRTYEFNETALALLCEGYYGAKPRIGWLELWGWRLLYPAALGPNECHLEQWQAGSVAWRR